MSHVKNVQAFGKLKGICTGYGGAYHPGQQNLQVDALDALFINAQQAMDAVIEAHTVYNNVTNTRELVFDGLPALASTVVSILKSGGAHRLTLEDARTICRKIRGYRLPKPGEDRDNGNGEAPLSSTPVYGMDFATLVSHFARLVELAESESGYMPNEPALTVDGLNAKLAELQAANRAVLEAEVQLAVARRQRDTTLYKGVHNLVRTAMATRDYVRAIFGFRSPQHLEITRLRFTKPKV